MDDPAVDKAHAFERRRKKNRRRAFPGQLQEYTMAWHGLQLMHKSRGTTHMGASHVDSWVQGSAPMPSLSSTEPINLGQWRERAKASMRRFEAALQVVDEVTGGGHGINIDVSDLTESSLVDIVQATRGPNMQVDASLGLSGFDQQLMQLPDLGALLRSMEEGTFDPSAMMVQQYQLEMAASAVEVDMLDLVPALPPPADAGGSETNREEVRIDLRNQLFDTWRARLSTAKGSLRSLSELDASLRGPSEKETRSRLLSQAEKELLEAEGRLKRKVTHPPPTSASRPSMDPSAGTTEAAAAAPSEDSRVKVCRKVKARSDN